MGISPGKETVLDTVVLVTGIGNSHYSFAGFMVKLRYAASLWLLSVLYINK